MAIIGLVKQAGHDPWLPYTDGGSFGVAFFTIIGDYDGAFDVCQSLTFLVTKKDLTGFERKFIWYCCANSLRVNCSNYFG